MADIKTNGQKKKGYFDYTLLFILLFLLGFGLVMVYSTSAYTSSLANDGDGLVYLRKQLIATAIGLVVMFLVSFFPYNLYIMLSPFAYIFSIISIFLVLTPLGKTAYGATRWIVLFGVSIQVAEIVKIAVILFTAMIIFAYRERNEKERNSWKCILVTLAPAFVGAALIFVITNNLSSAIIIFGIAFLMFFVSNPRNVKLYILVGLGILAVTIALIVLYNMAANAENAGDLNFRFERVFAWFDPEKYADGKGFQTLQSLYSIGSGGPFGKGLGKSMQKLGFLPEANNDMIFAIICEELGLFGGFAVILMFILLLYRLLDIASLTNNYYGSMVIAGVFSHIAIQVILNISVATNTIPNTGISLPFISYGGSSIIFLLTEMGIVMNIARSADFTPKKKVKKTIEKMPERQEEGSRA